MRITPIGPDARDAIAQLERSAFAAGAWDVPAIAASLADPFGLHLGLWSDQDALVGVALGQVLFEHAELLRIIVAPAARRTGQGRALFAAFAAACGARGAEVLSLEVRASNHAARALYVDRGMQAAGCRRGYYADGEDAVLMACAL